MKKDDKTLLTLLGILGALILASGTGTAVFMAHHGSKTPFGDFIFGSAAMVLALAVAVHTMDE